MIWIALFSQTGSEIKNIQKIIKRQPDLIMTNNCNVDQWQSNLDKNKIVIRHKFTDICDDLRSLPRSLITLHGFLKILPPDVCAAHDIYNGHPAPIHLYPELKGKDKQECLVNRMRYPMMGAVIHKVTPVVDDGEIIVKHDEPNTIVSAEDSYSKLKDISLKTWVEFFKQKDLK